MQGNTEYMKEIGWEKRKNRLFMDCLRYRPRLDINSRGHRTPDQGLKKLFPEKRKNNQQNNYIKVN